MANEVIEVDFSQIEGNSYDISDTTKDYIFENCTELSNKFSINLTNCVLSTKTKIGNDFNIKIYPDDFSSSFTITIKDYFLLTDYKNNDLIGFNTSIVGHGHSILSLLNNNNLPGGVSLQVKGQGEIIGSDFDEEIHTDLDSNGSEIDSNDIIYTEKGEDLIVAGKGDDIINLGEGIKYIPFNMGDGNDTIYLKGAQTVILVVESALTNNLGYDKYYDLAEVAWDSEAEVYDYTILPKPNINILSYQKSSDDLIISIPSFDDKKDTITIKDYFSGNNNTDIRIWCPENFDIMNGRLIDNYYDYEYEFTDNNGYNRLTKLIENNITDADTDPSENPDKPDPSEEPELKNIDFRTYNKKGTEVAKTNKIFVEKGDYSVFTGKGNDTITLNEGNMLLNFAKGDGTDTVYLNGATSLILNFDSVRKESNDVLSYQKQGDDLIIISPSGTKKDDSVIIKDYFTQNNNTEISIGNSSDKTALDGLLDEKGIVLAGSSKRNNTFVDTEYNDTINGGEKVDQITLNGKGHDVINLNTGNDIIKFSNLYEGNNDLSITTGKGTKTIDVSNIDNAEIVVTRNNSDLQLGFNIEDANDVVINDYFKSGATLSLKDGLGTRTLKYGAGKVSGTKGSDIVFASADKKGKITVSTQAGNDNITVEVQKGDKITVSAGDGDDYIFLNTENLGTKGKDTFTANLNGGKDDDTYDLSSVDLAKGKIVVNMKDGSDKLVLAEDTSFGGYSSEQSDFSYEHTINNGNSVITNNYHSFDYSNDLSLFFDVQIDKRGISHGFSRTGDLFLVKGADMELADGKVDRGIQLNGISNDDCITIGGTSYSLNDNAVGRLMSDVASWLSENDYISTADVFKTGDVNDIHTLIDMYATGTNQCFVKQ